MRDSERKKKKKGRKRFTREPLLMASNTGPETPSSVPDPPRPSSAYRARCYLARWIGRCGEWKRPRRNQHPGLVVFPLPRVHGRIVGNLHPSTRLTRDIRSKPSRFRISPLPFSLKSVIGSDEIWQEVGSISYFTEDIIIYRFNSSMDYVRIAFWNRSNDKMFTSSRPVCERI